MGIKLHYHPLSTYSRRVLIAFAEKQIPHELIVVDMAARRHREQPYLSLNPYGRVPTLEEDGSCSSNRPRFSIIWRQRGQPRLWYRRMRVVARWSTCT
jgi:glutathione S-transferase